MPCDETRHVLGESRFCLVTGSAEGRGAESERQMQTEDARVD